MLWYWSVPDIYIRRIRCSSKQHIRRTVPECHYFRGVHLSGDGLSTSKACKKNPTKPTKKHCVRTVLLPVQCIDHNNWKQDIIFSLNTSNLNAAYKQLTKKVFLEYTSGADQIK